MMKVQINLKWDGTIPTSHIYKKCKFSKWPPPSLNMPLMGNLTVIDEVHNDFPT